MSKTRNIKAASMQYCANNYNVLQAANSTVQITIMFCKLQALYCAGDYNVLQAVQITIMFGMLQAVPCQ